LVEEGLQDVGLTCCASAFGLVATVFPALAVVGADREQHELAALNRIGAPGAPVDIRVVQFEQIDVRVHPVAAKQHRELHERGLPRRGVVCPAEQRGRVRQSARLKCRCGPLRSRGARQRSGHIGRHQLGGRLTSRDSGDECACLVGGRIDSQHPHFREVVDRVLGGNQPGLIPAGMIDVGLHTAGMQQQEAPRRVAVLRPDLLGLVDPLQSVAVAVFHIHRCARRRFCYSLATTRTRSQSIGLPLVSCCSPSPFQISSTRRVGVSSVGKSSRNSFRRE
jgi:hypothetical protein